MAATPHDTQSLLQAAKQKLRDVFGLDAFRGVQEAAIRAVFEGKDALVLMPTGAGKSLCYALPAAVLQGLVLVVSPLIALMQDQVSSLRAKGLRVDFLSSTRSEAERRSILSNLAAVAKLPRDSAVPDGALLQLLYVTPELISKNEGFMDILMRLHGAERLALLAIDEAHCISSWGHDFRPAYRQLSSLRRRLPGTPMLALTATASHKVRDDVVASLALRSPSILAMSFNRPNIHYSVEYVDLMGQGNMQLASMEGNISADAGAVSLDTAEAAAYLRLLELIRQAGTSEEQTRQKQQEEQQQLDRCSTGRSASCNTSQATATGRQPSTAPQSGRQWQAPCAVVYVLKRTTADALAARLARDGVPAAAYHAKLRPRDREHVLEQWQAGHVRVVCATTAFGMGIDKADVRLVVHWNLPKTMEGLYQESGRAGRDGLPSRSVVMYCIADRRRMDYILQKEAERSTTRKRKRSSQPAQAATSAATNNCPAAAFGEVVEYCTAAHCRRAFLLHHFGEVLQRTPSGGANRPSASNSSNGGDGACCCDHCADAASVSSLAAQLREMEQAASLRFAGAWQGSGGGMSRARGARGGGDDGNMFGGWGAGSSDEEGSDGSGSRGSDDEPNKTVSAASAAVAAAKRADKKAGGSFLDAMLAAEQAHNETASNNARSMGGGSVDGLLAPRALTDPVTAPAKPKQVDPQTRALAQQRLASVMRANTNLAFADAHTNGNDNIVQSAAAVLAAAVEHTLFKPGMSALQYRGAVTAAAKALQQARSLLDVPGVQEPGSCPEAVTVVLQSVLAELSGALKGGDVAAATPANAAAGTGTFDNRPSTGTRRGGSTAAAPAVRMLQGLAGLPITVQVLEQTGAAKQVRALRKHGDAAVAAAAAATIEAWRGRVTAAARATTSKHT